MLQQIELAGSFTLPGTAVSVNRMGYGAMQIAGRDGNKLVCGPPRNVDEAIAALQEAVARGVNHIDTADLYGPQVTNQIIRRALSPYPGDLVIVIKVGLVCGRYGSIHRAQRVARNRSNMMSEKQPGNKADNHEAPESIENQRTKSRRMATE